MLSTASRRILNLGESENNFASQLPRTPESMPVLRTRDVKLSYHDVGRGSRTARGPRSARAWAAAAMALAGCGGLPAPPPLMPVPAPPQVEGVTLQEWPKPQLVPPRPIAPTVRWEPPYPVDGTLVAMLVEPAPTGLPLLVVGAHTWGVKIHLVPLAGGRYLGLVGAPIAALSIPVEIDVTFMDGTRLTRS